MKPLFSFLLLVPILSYSQIDTISIKKAGIQLVEYQKMHRISLCTQGIGLTVLSFGLTNKKEYPRTTIIGLFITFIGLEINANADIYIKKSGIYLHGDSIKYDFGGK